MFLLHTIRICFTQTFCNCSISSVAFEDITQIIIQATRKLSRVCEEAYRLHCISFHCS